MFYCRVNRCKSINNDKGQPGPALHPKYKASFTSSESEPNTNPRCGNSTFIIIQWYMQTLSPVRTHFPTNAHANQRNCNTYMKHTCKREQGPVCIERPRTAAPSGSQSTHEGRVSSAGGPASPTIGIVGMTERSDRLFTPCVTGTPALIFVVRR